MPNGGNQNYLSSYLDFLGSQGQQYQGVNPQIANFIQSMKARSPQAMAVQGTQAGGEAPSPVNVMSQITDLGNTYLDMQQQRAEIQAIKGQGGGQQAPVQQGSVQSQVGTTGPAISGLGTTGVGPPEATQITPSLQASPSYGADVGIDVGAQTPIAGGGFDLGTSIQGLGQGGQTAPQTAVQAGGVGSKLGGAIGDVASQAYGGLGQTAGQIGQAVGSAAKSAGSGIAEIASAVMSMMSDEDVKKKKKKTDDHMEAFLDALNAYQFEFKNEKHGKGKKYGVMAQDLEKSKVGKAMVEEGPEGKMIDMASGLGTTMAALGYINDRLKKLENNKNA